MSTSKFPIFEKVYRFHIEMPDGRDLPSGFNEIYWDHWEGTSLVLTRAREAVCLLNARMTEIKS